MIKTDLGKVGSPFYEQKLDNGLNVIFLPRKSRLNCSILSLPCGSFRHEESINSVKVPFGCAFFLQNMILSDKTKEEFRKKETIAKTIIDYSYTSYSLETLGDIFESTSLLLNKILRSDFNEDAIDNFKRSIAADTEKRALNPLLASQKNCLNNLYFSSPIRQGIYPDESDCRKVHNSSLSKFQLKYYQGINMTLFLSGDMTVKDVSEKIETLKVPAITSVYSKDIENKEDYDKVVEAYSECKMKSLRNYLTFGLKFPKRESLYENYGQMIFYIYEILLAAAFKENEDFLSGVHEADSDLVDCSLKEGGEDTVLLLTFTTLSSSKLVSFLTDYVTGIAKHVSHGDYKRVIESYYATSLAKLALPNSALYEFNRVYPNGLPYTSLIGYTAKLSYASFRKFLEDMSTFLRAASFVEKE